MTKAQLDRIRQASLNAAHRSERWFKALIALAGIAEVGGLTAYLLVMDFGERLHWLILIAAGLVYMTTAFWTWALAAHATTRSHRLLKAIDLLHDKLDPRVPASPQGP